MKYFVLKPKGNDIYAQASRDAMIQYAKTITIENNDLSQDILEWVLREQNKAKENK